ncbi:hypothetical protein M758_1G106600 [Ceratodon purpureus]|nr:hypothetical protein M758_1G106600 [Ceratodon purpureus]
MANQTQHGDHLDTESESESESLRLWFHSVDTDHSNSINVDELQVALEASNLRFPKTIVAQMIRMYDADQNGSMSFEEFTSLHNFLNTVHFAFSNVARNQQSISLNEVYMALHQAGFSLDQPSFLTTCQVCSGKTHIQLKGLSLGVFRLLCSLTFSLLHLKYLLLVEKWVFLLCLRSPHIPLLL